MSETVFKYAMRVFINTRMKLHELSSFENWFAGSKVVDKNGNPLRMYHVTKNEFENFAPGSHFGTATAAKHRFNTLSPKEKKGFERKVDNFRTYPVYLSIKNPLKVQDLTASDESTLFNYIKQEITKESFLGAESRFKDFDLDYAWKEGAYKALEKIGYDGVVYKNNIEDRGKYSWVIFHPDQVRFALTLSESYDDEEDFTPPELPETVLPAGTTVYHGTAAKFSNSESLESPCWVTTSIDVAKRFVDWHQHSPKGKRRILQYVTTRPLTLLKIERNTMNDLDEYHGVDTRDPHEMADGVLSIRSKNGNRFDGWVISGNYHDGDDIMLGDSGVLSFVKTKILKEAHHEYDNIDYKTEFKPLKKNDTFRVFHGFYLMSDAVHTAKYGLTGAEYADRRYSYESNNNPKGLFVTLKLDVAKEFSSQVIIEFVAREDELEPPVWPGGGYTVQGQMAQYFPHGAAGRAARAARRKESGKETENSIRKNPNDMKHVMFSDDRYKAMLLFASREHQALYMGHLNPSRISAFWVSDQPQRDGKYATWSRLSVQDFLEKYGTKEEKRSYEKDVSRRVFAPEDNFDPELFKERITKAIRSNSEDANPDELMRDIYNFYLKDGQGRRVERFQQVMHHYLWPKQLGPALRWIVKNYSNA